MPAARTLLSIVLAIAASTVGAPVGASTPQKPQQPEAQLPETVPLLAPGNDSFAAASDVAIPSTQAGSTVGATTEPGEPLPCGDIGATVWYRLSASDAVSVAVDTSGSAFDTVLAAYRGTSLDDLELLQCNDDSGWTLQSKVGFTATPGETYYLQLGGYGGERGAYTLSVGVGGAISGLVTGEGEDLGAACVDLYAADGAWIDGAYVAGPAAAYRFSAVAAGEYKVGFFDCSDEPRHIDEYYDDAPDLASASLVTVQEGQETSGIDAVLSLGGTISGTVTGADGSPIAYPCVDVVRPDGSWVAFAVGEGGLYTVGGLAAGDYLVRFQDCWGGAHAYEWYEDADSRLNATPVLVALGQEIGGVDARLPLAATISGTVTDEATGDPLEGVCIDAHDAAGDHAASGYGGSSGYTVWGLRGEVTLRFQDCFDGSHAYEWYDDAAARATATPVATSEGANTPEIDAALGPAGWIRGRVRNHLGGPVPGACVDAYDAAGEWAAFGVTGPQGRYTLRGLRGGDYRLRLEDCWGGGYTEQWWDGRASLAEADPVGVSPGAVTTGIDAVLEAPRLLFLQDDGETRVAEGGAGDRFGVGLGQTTIAETTVTLETDGQVTVEPTTMTFAAGDATAREVLVQAVDDELPEGPHWSRVTLRTSGDDPALGSLVQTFWVLVDDDDLVPAATALIYEGDMSAARGTEATFAARLVDAETGEGIPWQLLRLHLGNQDYPMWTDEEGLASRELPVMAPYGSYEVRVSFAGDVWYLPSEVVSPFDVVWLYAFEDDLVGGRSVLWNPPTSELRFVAPGDTSEIKQGPVAQTLISPTGHRLTVLAYADPALAVELDWERETGRFAAAVKTASNAYVLSGTP